MRDMIVRLISVVLFAIISIQQGQAQKTAPEDCSSSVHAIIARGEGSGNDLDVMVTLRDAIIEQIPGSTSLGLPYDHNGTNKFNDVYCGALMVQNYVNEYVMSCPRAKLALIGYSLGAVTTMDAVCGASSRRFTPVQPMDPSLADKVIAVVGYGDETWTPKQPWNRGTCENGLGTFPRLNPRACDPFAASIRNYCDLGDVECCSLLPWDWNAAHHTYINKYNQDVVDFIKARLDGSA